jgi:Protein of unknown function (DUF3761)
MDELLKDVTSLWNVLWVIALFGFAPGFFLHLIVLAYPRSDPRRRELIAELYVIPRRERPLWVAEQLATALFEGLGRRVSAGIRRRPLALGSIAVTAIVLVIAFAGAGTPANPVATPVVAGPLSATAQCSDGVYSFSQYVRGTCSGHGGVATWLTR